MKDIPIFTTDWGVASLILKEIPCKQIAYVKVQDVQQGHIKELCEECVGFCRAAGAETVIASGHPELECYPYFASVYEMRLSGFDRALTDACLFPVTEETVGKWRKIYNEKMAEVDYAVTMTAFDEKEIVNSGGTYFVHSCGKLLGIGWLNGSELMAVASVVPGMGELVTRTLLTAADSDSVRLQVVSTNERAVRLYHRMGFLMTREVNRGYRIR